MYVSKWVDKWVRKLNGHLHGQCTTSQLDSNLERCEKSVTQAARKSNLWPSGYYTRCSTTETQVVSFAATRAGVTPCFPREAGSIAWLRSKWLQRRLLRHWRLTSLSMFYKNHWKYNTHVPYYITVSQLKTHMLFNPLSLNGDQHQFSPNDIHTLSKQSLWELIKWSWKIFYQIFSANSKEMYRAKSGEFVCGYWDF